MSSSTEEYALLDRIIENVRELRGVHQIPGTVSSKEAFRLTRLIQRQRSDLHRSGIKTGLRVLTKRICEAQQFSNDHEENWVLQYAYQVVVMFYFGEMRRRYAVRNKEHKQYLEAVVQQEGGYE